MCEARGKRAHFLLAFVVGPNPDRVMSSFWPLSAFLQYVEKKRLNILSSFRLAVYGRHLSPWIAIVFFFSLLSKVPKALRVTSVYSPHVPLS